MLENEKQRRWWFANHPEYSNSRKGRRNHANGEGHDDQETVSPESVDAYVDEALKDLDGPEAALLKSFKRNFGTQAEENRNETRSSDDVGAEGSKRQASQGRAGAGAGNPYGPAADGQPLSAAMWNSPARTGPRETEKGISKLVYQTIQGNPFLIAYDRDGNLIGTYAASSGMPGETDPRIPWKGPIPPGSYTLFPAEIDPTNSLTNPNSFFRQAAWGKYRVRLHPNAGTHIPAGRNPNSFFLHGGFLGRSGGCINIGDNDRWLFQHLMRQKGPIRVEVK